MQPFPGGSPCQCSRWQLALPRGLCSEPAGEVGTDMHIPGTESGDRCVPEKSSQPAVSSPSLASNIKSQGCSRWSPWSLGAHPGWRWAASCSALLISPALSGPGAAGQSQPGARLHLSTGGEPGQPPHARRPRDISLSQPLVLEIKPPIKHFPSRKRPRQRL